MGGLALACSGRGAGADACEQIEHARCERSAACDAWSEQQQAECLRDGDAQCRAGATGAVRDMSDEEVADCAAAIRAADCAALDNVAAIDACQRLRRPTDAGQDAAD